jgi:hypothetical protein
MAEAYEAVIATASLPSGETLARALQTAISLR